MDMNSFIEYMKIHLVSLHQDADKLQNLMDEFEGDFDSDEYRDLEITDMNNTGEIMATSHLIAVAEGRV